METKKEALQHIRALADSGVISREEIVEAFDSAGIKADVVLTKAIGVAEILYYIGGGVVCLGLAILVFQNWETLGFGTKLLATLGSAIAAFISGLLFNRDKKTEAVGAAFFLISALVMPIGLWVLIDNVVFDANSYRSHSFISAAMLGMCLLSLLLLRKNIFTLFSVLFGTWLFFSLTGWMTNSTTILNDWKFFMHRVFVASIAYILIGNAFSKDKRAPLSGFLYGFGIFGLLGSALWLGEWKPNQSIVWELIYPFLVFGALFHSVQIKRKVFLTAGTLFLMIFILKITSEYFSVSLGWPFALVIAGLSMIGVGYISLSINKKYLSPR